MLEIPHIVKRAKLPWADMGIYEHGMFAAHDLRATLCAVTEARNVQSSRSNSIPHSKGSRVK